MIAYIVKASDTRTWTDIQKIVWSKRSLSGYMWGDYVNPDGVFGQNPLDITWSFKTSDHKYPHDIGLPDNFSQILIDWNGSGWIRDYALTQSKPNNGFFDGSKPDLYKPMNSYELPAQSIIDYANGEELKILLGIEIESWTSDWMTQLSPPQTMMDLCSI